MNEYHNGRVWILFLLTGLICAALFLFRIIKKQIDVRHEEEEGLFTLVCPQLAVCGDAFLMYNGDGAVMIDTGEAADAERLTALLEERGVESLDALILTHYDKDHIGGAATILAEIPVRACYMTCGEEDSDEYAALMDRLADSETERLIVTETETFAALGAEFTIYPPLTAAFEKNQDNNLSLLVSVKAEQDALLFTGDAQRERLEQYFESQYDGTAYNWLKVPWHGRGEKTVRMLLDHFTPEDALITSSEEEPEREEVVSLLSDAGARVWLSREGTAEFTIGASAGRPAEKTEEAVQKDDSGEEAGNSGEAVDSDTEERAEKESSEEKKTSVPAPIFSKTSGFYEKEFDLAIEVPEGTKVYYSLDSSNPGQDSSLYEAPIKVRDVNGNQTVYSIRTDFWPYTRNYNGYNSLVTEGWYSRCILPEHVDKCQVVRAVAIDAEGNRSDTVTASYYIGYEKKKGYENLAVLSLVSDPDDLFSDDRGIMVNGAKYKEKWASGAYDLIDDTHDIRKSCNSYTGRGREWEREVHMDYFDEEGHELVFSQEAGIRLHGNQARVAESQKSFNLYARKSYDGHGTFLKPFYEDGLLQDTVTLMRGIDVRNYYLSGKMNGRTMDSQQYVLCQVFLDGEYWGVYAIQERYNSDSYLKTHYNLDKDDYILAKGGPTHFDIKNGDSMAIKTSFREVRDYAMNTDLSVESHYRALCDMIDEQSFIDAYAARLYTGDQDWSWRKNQIMLYYDHKWHWTVYDMDYGAGAHETAHAYTDTFTTTRLIPTDSLETDPLFPYLMKSPVFCRNFVNTFLDLGNEVYSGENVSKDMDQLQSLCKEAGVLLSERCPSLTWKEQKGTAGYVSDFDQSCQQIREYFNYRFSYAARYLKSYFGLKGELARITVKNETPEGGRVFLNTISPEPDSKGCFDGQYYTDYPVSLKAEPEEGWTFAGWKTDGGSLSDENAPESELSFSGDVTVTAVFEKE